MDNFFNIPESKQSEGHGTCLSERQLSITRLRFNIALHTDQIAQFRKLINLYIGSEDDRFHNHNTINKYHYRYPVIQYKVEDRKACIMGLGESGDEAIHKLCLQPDFRTFFIYSNPGGVLMQELSTEQLLLVPQLVYEYTLNDYIAFNDANHGRWRSTPSLAVRAALLENCLVGHILKFASAIRWQLPPKSLQVALTDFHPYQVQLFNNYFMAFRVRFRTNISLPPGIGLGKAVSHGLGVLAPGR